MCSYIQWKFVKSIEYQSQIVEEQSCHKFERKQNKVKLQAELQHKSYNNMSCNNVCDYKLTEIESTLNYNLMIAESTTQRN
jgi:hypothetical protein